MFSPPLPISMGIHRAHCQVTQRRIGEGVLYDALHRAQGRPEPGAAISRLVVVVSLSAIQDERVDDAIPEVSTVLAVSRYPHDLLDLVREVLFHREDCVADFEIVRLLGDGNERRRDGSAPRQGLEPAAETTISVASATAPALEWEPTKKAFAKECTRFDACFEAFKSAASSPCGRAGGGQNVMASEGSFDRGCGKYKWSITPPKPREPGTRYKPLNGPGEQFCHNEFNFPKHKDVRREDVINQASYACAAAPQKFTKDTPRWQQKYTVSGTDYFFSIEWRGGCRTDVEEQDIGKLDGKNSYPNCWHMMHDSWAKCNNGGVGGNRQAGCLEYTFSPHMAE
ncbi:hypothetical protein CMUS01_09446 [Colletotrichum musicola]|uniref:Uncharacterized protein n=1 Tax=Colletotrichum musicola TaxID=2175873 RepID=A0A8H6K7E6_9PEZI|nr:hypothetical protein CMUS01_09446 [Colletotrichum musicola]